MGVFQEGGSRNSWAVLQTEVAIAGEASNSGKNALTLTDRFAKKTQQIQLFENPLPGAPPFAIPNIPWMRTCTSLRCFCPRCPSPPDSSFGMDPCACSKRWRDRRNKSSPEAAHHAFACRTVGRRGSDRGKRGESLAMVAVVLSVRNEVNDDEAIRWKERERRSGKSRW